MDELSSQRSGLALIFLPEKTKNIKETNLCLRKLKGEPLGNIDDIISSISLPIQNIIRIININNIKIKIIIIKRIMIYVQKCKISA